VTVAETPELTPAIAYEVSTTPSVLLPNLPGSRTFYWHVEAISSGGSRINEQPSGTFTSPAILAQNVAFASDMQWIKATAGADNPVRRDKNLIGQTLKINGQPFGKGLWTHAFNDTTPADIVFDVSGKKFTVFKASVGLDDLGTQGSVQFQVLADGQMKAESPIMLPRKVHDLAVDVTGAKEITLRVLNGGDGYSYDHAVWGLARFMEAGEKDPFEQAKP
jgi:NPCBM/NEW2 domain